MGDNGRQKETKKAVGLVTLRDNERLLETIRDNGRQYKTKKAVGLVTLRDNERQ